MSNPSPVPTFDFSPYRADVPRWSARPVGDYRVVSGRRARRVPAAVAADTGCWNLYWALSARVSGPSEARVYLAELPVASVALLPKVLRHRVPHEGSGHWTLRAWMCRLDAPAFMEAFGHSVASIAGLPADHRHGYLDGADR